MRTQGTWEVSKHATPEYAPQYGIYADGARNDLCTVKSENAEDDAEFICKAVNCHKDLLEACKGHALHRKMHLRSDFPNRRCGFCDSHDLAINEAIAKAE